MPKTRLFHTLIICGAAMTGGAVAITTVAAVASVAGCSDQTYEIIDMSLAPVDMAQPQPHDMAHYAIIDY